MKEPYIYNRKKPFTFFLHHLPKKRQSPISNPCYIIPKTLREKTYTPLLAPPLDGSPVLVGMAGEDVNVWLLVVIKFPEPGVSTGEEG